MKVIFVTLFVAANLAGAPFALAQGNGKGGGGGGGGGGNEEPPAEFVPKIAYFEQTRKGRDLRLANRAGDQACLVVQSQGLRGFSYDAANKRLAYSIGETGVYLASWTDDPCKVGTPTKIRSLSAGVHPEFMDFSPDGTRLVWTEPDPVNHNSYRIWTHEIGSSTGPSALPLEGWLVFGVRFSPQFATSRELIFIGGANDLSLGWGAYTSIFAYNVDNRAIRKVLDGEGRSLDAFVSVTNPGGIGGAKVAVTDNDSRELLQISLSDGSIVKSFPGYEPAYSCDNSELIHRGDGKGTKLFTYITPANGSPQHPWSQSDLRWFDWFCP